MTSQYWLRTWFTLGIQVTMSLYCSIHKRVYNYFSAVCSVWVSMYLHVYVTSNKIPFFTNQDSWFDVIVNSHNIKCVSIKPRLFDKAVSVKNKLPLYNTRWYPMVIEYARPRCKTWHDRPVSSTVDIAEQHDGGGGGLAGERTWCWRRDLLHAHAQV